MFPVEGIWTKLCDYVCDTNFPCLLQCIRHYAYIYKCMVSSIIMYVILTFLVGDNVSNIMQINMWLMWQCGIVMGSLMSGIVIWMNINQSISCITIDITIQ